jgi:hypothetical protein
MAYTGQVKRKLGKVLGHNSMTPKIVGLKIGCPKTWTRTCASCPYHMMLVPHNLKRRGALMMSQKLGKTYYKPSCSGFCHLITIPNTYSLIKWCCTEKAIFQLTTRFEYDHYTCYGFNKEAPTTRLLGRFYRIVIFKDVAEGIFLHSLCG